jgi:hypothetical protein
LLRREAGGQLTQKRQEPMLVFFHTQDQSCSAPESEQESPHSTQYDNLHFRIPPVSCLCGGFSAQVTGWN